MARCSCAGSSCSCSVQAGLGLALSGTGNAASPFMLSLASPYEEWTHDVDGPLDFSLIEPFSVISVDLDGDVGDVTFPTDSRGQFEVLLKQGATPRTITWPAGVRWAGGMPPTLTTVADHSDLLTFRRLGNTWVGSLAIADIG